MRYIFMTLFFVWCSHIVSMELSKEVGTQPGIDPIEFLLQLDPENRLSPVRSWERFHGFFPHIPLDDDLKDTVWRKHNLLVFMGKEDHSAGSFVTQEFEYGSILSRITAEMVPSLDWYDLQCFKDVQITSSEILKDIETYIPERHIPKEKYSELQNIAQKAVYTLINNAITEKERSGISYVNVNRRFTEWFFYDELQRAVVNAVKAKFKPEEDQVITIKVSTRVGLLPSLQQLLKK